VFTVEGISEGGFKDKGSRFIALLYRVDSVEEVNKLNSELWTTYNDARHICYAYKIDKQTRENDDGEPNHSAGSPIMRQILSANLTHVVIFVVRYFGGIKLGVPGLIQAYGVSSQEAIRKATIIEYIEKIIVQIKFNYPSTNHIKYLIEKHKLEQTKADYSDLCTIWLSIPKNDNLELMGIFKNYIISWDLDLEIN